MIIVVGSVVSQPGREQELSALCMEHSRRSRGEKGCLLHAVHRDLEEPTRLVFVEEWEDRLSLDAHFSLRSSRDFVRSARRMAAQEPVIQVFEAARVDI